jgi:hypothetical protein
MILIRVTAWENWHILGKSNSHYYLLSWNSHQIFFSLNKKYELNIFSLQNCAPPFLQSSKSAVLQFSWKRTLFLLFYVKIFKITKCKNKVYGSLNTNYCFFISNLTFPSRKLSKIRDGIFFLISWILPIFIILVMKI